MTRLALLPDRAVVEVAGEDRVAFLQGLVSNDVTQAAPGRAIWAALLTPQGKWLADFFILSDGERLLLDCEQAQASMIVQRLSRFRLRSKVAIAAVPMMVHAAWNGVVEGAALRAPDPRLPEAGTRELAQAPLKTTARAEDYDLHRLGLGLPDGSRDLEPEKAVLLEAGFDELNGISWTKGCYMGQELTARTKYRGLVKRRLVPVSVEGALPAPGTPVLRDGREVGTMRSGRDRLGMALLRLEALEDRDLACGDARLTPRVPAWMRLPEPSPGPRT
jgi:folate-binding protein YgfZ